MSLAISKREKVFLNGWEYWIDREKQILYDKEDSINGIHYDSDNQYFVRSKYMTKDECRQLLNHLKNKKLDN